MENSNTKAKIDGNTKWGIAIVAGLIFFLLSMPAVYKLTNQGSRALQLPTTSEPGGPTGWGMFLHFLVFVIVFRIALSQF